jgi:hypothetical protein
MREKKKQKTFHWQTKILSKSEERKKEKIEEEEDGGKKKLIASTDGFLSSTV